MQRRQLPKRPSESDESLTWYDFQSAESTPVKSRVGSKEDNSDKAESPGHIYINLNTTENVTGTETRDECSKERPITDKENTTPTEIPTEIQIIKTKDLKEVFKTRREPLI